jgi:hypothetical protein
MSRRNIGRIVLAVVAGYLADAVLVTATEGLFSWLLPSVNSTPPLHYFIFDLISQCVYTVAGGYLCCAIAGPTQRFALGGLMGLGMLVGSIFLVASWRAEPHWYGIALLGVYPPCVWLGWRLRARREEHERVIRN